LPELLGTIGNLGSFLGAAQSIRLVPLGNIAERPNPP
jgi:hypothetical protein